jgi:hypothetical protein
MQRKRTRKGKQRIKLSASPSSSCYSAFTVPVDAHDDAHGRKSKKSIAGRVKTFSLPALRDRCAPLVQPLQRTINSGSGLNG